MNGQRAVSWVDTALWGRETVALLQLLFFSHTAKAAYDINEELSLRLHVLLTASVA